MGCSCKDKKKNGAATSSAPAASVPREVRRIRRQVNQDTLSAPVTGRYARQTYYVFADGTEPSSGKPFPTLAEAQKRQRDLGAGWRIEAIRAQRA
jgi:hypothetical protein